MPRYDYDPSTISAGFALFPKGTYEFIIGEPKTFARNGQKGPNWGIQYVLMNQTEENGMKVGAKYFQNLYLHTPNTDSINKQFLLAAEGYTNKPEDEKRYNNDHLGNDWGFDTDSGSCGDAWRVLTGRRVVADMDTKIDPATGNEQQVARFRPL